MEKETNNKGTSKALIKRSQKLQKQRANTRTNAADAEKPLKRTSNVGPKNWKGSKMNQEGETSQMRKTAAEGDAQRVACVLHTSIIT